MEAVVDPLQTLDILVSRALDTAEDAALLASRVAAAPVGIDAALECWEDKADGRPRILVIGSGWAAHATVKIIEADAFRLLVVSPRNYFIFTPMLAASSVGTVEYRSIAEPMRTSNPRAAYLEGRVSDLDPSTRRATIRIGGQPEEQQQQPITLEYDVCVYAAGVQASMAAIPGVQEHCFFLKELEDAQRLRRAVASALEKASEPGLTAEEKRRMLTFVVVGGGATGVEYTGELSDFMLDALSRLYPQLQPYANVVLIHGRDELLPDFDEELRQKARRSLEGRGVEVRLGTRVQEVHARTHLTVLRTGEGNDGGSTSPEDIKCGLIVWAAGTGPVPLTERVRSRLDINVDDGTNRIRVDPWLRAVGAPMGTLIALGDAALCDGAGGEPLPQTAQVAAQQGAYVARMLNRRYDLTTSAGVAPVNREAAAADPAAWLRLRGAVEARPFQFLNLGLLAYLGGGEAISQVQVGDQRVLSEAGSTGFLLWRSVYVVKQVSPRTRFLVLFDWVKTKVFGRDVTSW